MKNERNKDQESNSSFGLRIIFSEKAFIVLLQVVLALSITHLEFYSPVKHEEPAKILPPIE